MQAEKQDLEAKVQVYADIYMYVLVIEMDDESCGEGDRGCSVWNGRRVRLVLVT